MRLAPVPILRHRDVERAARDAIEQSKTTHGAQECLDACRLLAVLLVEAIGGCKPERLLTPRELDVQSPSVRSIAACAWRSKERDQIRSTGYVVHTLEAALWCVARTGSFRDAVLLAVNLGDDADTVGAVTGQLAGALYGESRIPAAWRHQLFQGERIRELARALFTARSAEVDQ